MADFNTTKEIAERHFIFALFLVEFIFSIVLALILTLGKAS